MTMQKCGFLPNKSGIYQIKNLINNKIYIGSSKSMMKRKRSHLDTLRRNIHHSRKLQLSWNKYGENNFEFSVLEYCDVDLLETREQFYLDRLCPEFNISKNAYAATRGSKMSDSRKRAVSRQFKTLWKNVDFRQKVLKIVNSPEEHKRRSDNMHRLWKDSSYRKQHSESLYGKGNSKLSPDDVREIRRLYSLGVGSPTLCKLFRLKSTRSIFRILEGITYNWVD